MRDNPIITAYHDSSRQNVKSERYVSPPLEFISAFGCDYTGDGDLILEKYSFCDEVSNKAKMVVELLSDTVSIRLYVGKNEITNFHDEKVQMVKVQEDKNRVYLKTIDSEILFTVWPIFKLEILRLLD